jgi:dTDP-4-dehydrorhamnose 3,5-epimerase
MLFAKIPTSLFGHYLIEPQVFGDARGFFYESYSEAEFAKIGIENKFIQDNHSLSKKGALR